MARNVLIHTLLGFFAKISFDVPSAACAIDQWIDYTFYHRLVIYTCGPLLILAAFSLPFLYAKMRQLGNEMLDGLNQAAIGSGLFLVFLMYYPPPRALALLHSLFSSAYPGTRWLLIKVLH